MISELTKYFSLLPEETNAKKLYRRMREMKDTKIKRGMQKELKSMVLPGSIDVNIMTKLDNSNLDENGNELPEIYSDAKSALKGFALSLIIIQTVNAKTKIHIFFIIVCISFNRSLSFK